MCLISIINDDLQIECAFGWEFHEIAVFFYLSKQDVSIYVARWILYSPTLDKVYAKRQKQHQKITEFVKKLIRYEPICSRSFLNGGDVFFLSSYANKLRNRCANRAKINRHKCYFIFFVRHCANVNIAQVKKNTPLSILKIEWCMGLEVFLGVCKYWHCLSDQ